MVLQGSIETAIMLKETGRLNVNSLVETNLNSLNLCPEFFVQFKHNNLAMQWNQNIFLKMISVLTRNYLVIGKTHYD